MITIFPVFSMGISRLNTRISLTSPTAHFPQSSQLTRRKRMPSAEATIHRPSLSIHIAGTITSQESNYSRNLIRDTAPLQRVELPDLPLGAPLPGSLIHGGGHASLDQSWTYCITSDP